MTFKTAVFKAALASALGIGTVTVGFASTAGAQTLHRTYRVQTGDTLTKVAGRFGTTWQALAQLNRLTNPNLIYTGETLRISGVGSAASAPATGYSQPAPATSETTPSAAGTTASTGSTVNYGGGMVSCIIRHESGGNPDAYNSGSGAWGLYQFMPSTWSGNGGNPADFGHASAAEQQQVFDNTVAHDGYSPWAGDGC